jgi:hypothetical protein
MLRRGRLKRTAVVATGAVAGAALLKELRKPAGTREWHGQVAGFIPYDFRPPTVARFRATWWNPGDSRIFTERDIGIGWGVNIPSLAGFAREVLSR